jgi:predicted metal-dependent hydrolase
MQQLKLGAITVDVIQKNIKNVHLSVYPPTGRVRIAAPERMNLDTIRIYAISKLGWIKKQQTRFKNQEREAPREYITMESHYYNGKRYLLKVVEHDATPKVIMKPGRIELYVRPKTSREKKQIILEQWYRAKLKESVAEYISIWEPKMKVKVTEFGIKKMKTKWGTCNREAKRIWLNLELAKKPSQCLEYIVVHEMVHLLERKHNDRFVSFMDKFQPQWRMHKEELNRLPVSHSDWKY